jgi:NAD(P)-dependent dehydrogenase (short-subunit alcohol dehydrogenase family)
MLGRGMRPERGRRRGDRRHGVGGRQPGVQVTSHACDVSDEAQVLRFRDELLAEHTSDHVDLVFSNAGIGGGGSFVNGSRQEWERTFAVDWLEKEDKDKAPLSAAEAAAIILDGVRSGAWRILVGKDVAFVDERVRSRPESAYDYAEVFKDLPADLLQGVQDLPEGIKDQLPEWVKDQLPDDYLALSRLAGRVLRRRVRSGSSCSGGRRGHGRARCPGR